jgi:hypothetical protein
MIDSIYLDSGTKISKSSTRDKRLSKILDYDFDEVKSLMKVMKFILIKKIGKIIANKPYIVIKCYTSWVYIRCDIRVVDIENESGCIERYASNKFNKTIRQTRRQNNEIC